jgi:DNA end-binding protein Ku
MTRAVWSGSITFGLVNIPVKLYPATEPKDVRFHQYDRAGRRVRHKRVVEVDWEPPGPDDVADAEDRAWGSGAGERPADDRTPSAQPAAEGDAPPVDAAAAAGIPPEPDEAFGFTSSPAGQGRREVEVGFEDIVKGYETDDGRFVTLTSEDMERVAPEPSRSIDIEDFVHLSDIDPVYFEKTYHVAPQRSIGGEKPYALLLRALSDAGRVGIGRFILRTKPHLVAIRPMNGVLALETLFFGDEVRDAAPLTRSIEGIEVSERELELASMLIRTLETDWDPARYSDTYREGLLELIASKAGQERPIEEPQRPAGPSQAEQLIAALKASVEAARVDREEKAPPAKRRSRRKTG